jgi:hypothetical protein
VLYLSTRKHAFYFYRKKRGEKMALGNSNNIIVGAAQVWVHDAGPLAVGGNPAAISGEAYADTMNDDTDFTNIGYTMNGLELQFQPDFGEVRVDQILDVAKLFKQGMQVNLNTTFAESTLENLLIAVAGSDSDLSGDKATSDGQIFNIKSGSLGECPLERGLVAVGPGTGDCAEGSNKERIYVAYRALSIDNVTVSAKRDEATMFEVSFRLLPEDSTGSYGKIIDRTVTPAL